MCRETEDQILAKCIAALKSGRKPDKVPKEFLGSFKMGHRASVREFIDEELAWDLLKKTLVYNDQEARKALEWNTRYNNEYYRGVLKKNDPKAIHNTDKLYKEATDAHHARRRDIMAVERDSMVSYESPGKRTSDEGGKAIDEQFLNENRDLNHEDHLIELIDSDYGFKKKK